MPDLIDRPPTPGTAVPAPALLRPALAALWLALLVLWGCPARAVELNPDAPDSYTVQPGDTLWGIAARFLRDPWRWREVWRSNTDLPNPNLIYPGDVLRVTRVEGEPRIGVDRGGEPAVTYKNGMRVVKLTPRVRVTALKEPVPTIPIASIAPFLTQPYVADSDQVRRAPYVVGFPDERVVAGIGDAIYVRRIDSAERQRFQILRPGDALRDPKDNAVLGYLAVFVANAALERTGDPATLRVVRAEREVAIGDRVIPAALEEPLTNYFPRPAPAGLRGQILAVLNGVTQVGRFDVVIVNLGTHDRLEPGQVFEVFHGGTTQPDPVRRGGDDWNWREESPLSGDFWFGRDWETRRWRANEPDANTPLPPTPDMRRRRSSFIRPYERSGLLMVFRSFERVSFAIVLEATRPMHIQDRIAPPPA